MPAAPGASGAPGWSDYEQNRMLLQQTMADVVTRGAASSGLPKTTVIVIVVFAVLCCIICVGVVAFLAVRASAAHSQDRHAPH